MSDGNATKGLRERLAGETEDRLGRALADLFESPLLSGALGRASDAREKAVQAQELAMGALNLPSAADIERLTRRLRSVSQRLEGIEDSVYRLGRVLPGQGIDARLGVIEEQLRTLARTLGERATGSDDRQAAPGPATKRPAAKRPTGKGTTAKRPTGKGPTGKGPTGKGPTAKRPADKPSAAKRPAAKSKPASKARPAAKRAD